MTRDEQLNSIHNYMDVVKYHHDFDHWWCLSNIRQWLRFVRRRPKYAFQRAKHGYCSQDLWNFGEYFMMVIADGMREFANRSIGTPPEYCPDDADYDAAHEVWKGEVLDIARKIENILVENDVGEWTLEQRTQKNKEVFGWLAEHWDELWE